MTGLLRWLTREESLREALDLLLNAIPLDQRDQTRSKIASGVAMYDVKSLTVSDVEDEEAKLSQVMDHVKKLDQLGVPSDIISERLPEELYYDCSSLPLSQIVLNKSVIFSTQIESREEEGSRKFALPLTRDYCRIVFTNLNQLSDTEPVEVKVILRRGRGVAAETLVLDQPLSPDSEKDKRRYLLSTLNAEDTACEVNVSHRLIFACVSYWKYSSQPPPSALQILALLVCLEMWDQRELGKSDAWSEKVKKFTVADKSRKAIKGFDRALIQSYSNLQVKAT